MVAGILANWKILSGTALGASLIGAGGGYWLSGAIQAKKDLKATQASLVAEKAARSRQEKLTQDEVDRANRLSRDLQDTRQALNDAVSANAVLAARRAATSTQIIRDGEKIGQELEGDNAWIRYAWPSGLLEYANGTNTKPAMPGPESIGY